MTYRNLNSHRVPSVGVDTSKDQYIIDLQTSCQALMDELNAERGRHAATIAELATLTAELAAVMPAHEQTK